MDAHEIERRRDEIIAKYGPWVVHNLELAPGLWTMSEHAPTWGGYLRFTQVIADLAPRPFRELRILDIACAEGQAATEFALQGAEVVGVEGRESNLAKARFTKEVLGLDHLEYFQDDVRNLSVEKYGRFDVALMSGILYHLDSAGVFGLLTASHEMADIVVIDTQISLKPIERTHHGQHKYFGLYYEEFKEEPTKDEEEKAVWASMGNTRSFWPTRASLLNALTDVGFTSAYEVHNPAQPGKALDRVTIVARRGQPVRVHHAPDLQAARWGEEPSRDVNEVNREPEPEPKRGGLADRLKASARYRLGIR